VHTVHGLHRAADVCTAVGVAVGLGAVHTQTRGCTPSAPCTGLRSCARTRRPARHAPLSQL